MITANDTTLDAELRRKQRRELEQLEKNLKELRAQAIALIEEQRPQDPEDRNIKPGLDKFARSLLPKNWQKIKPQEPEKDQGSTYRAPVRSKGYEILEDGKAIKCLNCGLTSHNPHDVEEKYCGNCGIFHEMEALKERILRAHPELEIREKAAAGAPETKER